MADLLIMLADGVEAAGFLCRESLEVHVSSTVTTAMRRCATG